MRIMRLIYILIPAIILFSCSEEEEQPTEWTDEKSKTEVGTTTEVETVYEEGNFDHPVYDELLKELDLCGPAVEDCPRCADCSPRFFRFFDIRKDGEMKDLFAVQIKALTILKGQEFANPTREVRVYVREAGQLVESNRLKGYITERITSSSGVDDLIIRFFRIIDGEDHFFNCLFMWSREDKKYKFISVERIEGRNWGGPVKESEKAATSQQVYDELKAEGYIEGIL